MLPWDFWRLTPLEFELLLAGYRQRRRRWWWQLATVATWVIAPWSKKTVKAEQLLGWSQPFREE